MNILTRFSSRYEVNQKTFLWHNSTNAKDNVLTGPGTSTKISKATPPFCGFPSLYASYDHCQRTPKWHSSSALIKSNTWSKRFLKSSIRSKTAGLLVMRMKPTYQVHFLGHISESPSRKVISLVRLSIISRLFQQDQAKGGKMTDLTGYTIMFSLTSISTKKQ